VAVAHAHEGCVVDAPLFGRHVEVTAFDKVPAVRPDIVIRNITEVDWPAIAAIYQEGIDTRLATLETALPTCEGWSEGSCRASPGGHRGGRDPGLGGPPRRLETVGLRRCRRGRGLCTVQMPAASALSRRASSTARPTPSPPPPPRRKPESSPRTKQASGSTKAAAFAASASRSGSGSSMVSGAMLFSWSAEAQWSSERLANS
jgi:hypothetical protein